MWCSVINCKNGSRSMKYKSLSHVRFYRFPRDNEIAKIWVDACGQSDLNINIAYMCSLHFEPKCYNRPLIQTLHNYLPICKRKLTPLAIPTLNICTPSTDYGDNNELGTTTSTQIANNVNSDNITEQSEHELSIAIENDWKGLFEKNFPTVCSNMSVDQSQFNFVDNSHQSIKSENDLYLDADIPLLSCVKKEVTICHDDAVQLFHINNNINDMQEKYIEKNCKEDNEFNNLGTVFCSFKEEPEDKVFQPDDSNIRKEHLSSKTFKLEVDYNDKIIKIKKEIIDDTLYESEIVIENNEIHLNLKEEKCNADNYLELTDDSTRSIYKDLDGFNHKIDQTQSKSAKHIRICDLCNKLFTSKKLLIVHMKYHFPNNYCTDSNSKRACSKNIKHRKPKISKNIDKYECTICFKQFNDYSNCRRHIINHSSEKKFKCRICNKLYTTEYSLSVHIRVHTGEKPYKCDVCQLKFNRKDAMLAHRRTHEEKQQTYSCQDCHKIFSSKQSLLRHVKSRKTTLSCHYCQRTYTLRDSLIVHLRSKHTGDKPYKCQICKRDFFENRVLVRHMKIHDNKKMKE